MWNNDNLRNFIADNNQDTIRSKYGLGLVEGQVHENDPALSTIRQKLEHVRAVKNNNFDDMKSTHSLIPPSPNLLNEKLIWQSKIHRKN